MEEESYSLMRTICPSSATTKPGPPGRSRTAVFAFSLQSWFNFFYEYSWEHTAYILQCPHRDQHDWSWWSERIEAASRGNGTWECYRPGRYRIWRFHIPLSDIPNTGKHIRYLTPLRKVCDAWSLAPFGLSQSDWTCSRVSFNLWVSSWRRSMSALAFLMMA